MELRNYYHFAAVQDPELCKRQLLSMGRTLDVLGTILLAPEGINYALYGNAEALDILERTIETMLSIDITPAITKIADGDPPPFKKYKVKIKPELVKLGIHSTAPFDPDSFACEVGTHVSPDHWNELISDPGTLVLDVRNHYEYRLGHFRNATHPNSLFFHEFPQYLHDQLHNERKRKIAMYCTGGIRCEKSSSYMRKLGYDELYQLQGGILNYFAAIPLEKSLWEGACFVFDDRVLIDASMKPTLPQPTPHLPDPHLPDPPMPTQEEQKRHLQHMYKKIHGTADRRRIAPRTENQHDCRR